MVRSQRSPCGSWRDESDVAGGAAEDLGDGREGGGTKTKYQSEEGASVGDQRVRELLMPSGLGEESDL